jgi:hypothetical protein
MPDVLVAATVLSLLFAVLMTVIAARMFRDNRTRTSSRVEALQALAAEPPAMVEEYAPPVPEPAATAPVPRAFARPPAPRRSDVSREGGPHIADENESWDLALREEPLPAVSVSVRPSRPIPDQAPPRPAMPLRHAGAGFRTASPPPQSFGGRAFDIRTSEDSVPDHELFEPPIPPTPSRRWTWMAAAGLVMALGGGTFYLVASGVITRAIARHDANETMANAKPIELLSLRYASDNGNFVVTGLVQNPAPGVSLRSVFAIVYLFDAEGKFLSSARAALEAGVLSPGGESGFVVRVPAATDVTKYRVSFQHEDGAAVQHVDRRGALPANTTGDAVEAAVNRASLSAAVNGK